MKGKLYVEGTMTCRPETDTEAIGSPIVDLMDGLGGQTTDFYSFAVVYVW